MTSFSSVLFAADEGASKRSQVADQTTAGRALASFKAYSRGRIEPRW